MAVDATASGRPACRILKFTVERAPMPPPSHFPSYRAANPGASYCDWLRASSGPLWGAMVGHRFTRDMAADRLPPEAFLRYLRYEHAFVRSAVVVFGHAVVKAPTAADQAGEHAHE